MNIAPVDVSSFTPEQLKRFQAANALGSGVPITNIPPTPPAPAPTVTPQVTAFPNADLSKAGQPGYDVFGVPTADKGASVQTARDNSGTYTGQDGNQYYKYDGTPVTKTTDTTKTTTFTGDATGIDAANQQILQDKQAQLEAATTFNKTITDIRNGTIPLNPGQIAQLDGLKAQFQTMIDQQTLQNKGAVGSANIRGYQKGAGEYDNTFQTKTIASIASAGAAKVADLQVKMATAVAALTSSFQSDNIADVKTAYDTLKTAQGDYDTALKDYVEKTQKAIQDAAKTAADAAKAQQDAFETDVAKPLRDLSQTVLNNGGSPQLAAQVANAPSLSEGYALAGSYSAGGSGIIGEYNRYVADATARGQVPLSFDEYQTQDANRKAKVAAAAAGASGISNQTLIRVQSKAGQFDNEQTVKNYQTVAEAKNFVDSLGIGQKATAGDDQGLLYAFAKAMDPNSVVREGEYATVQKYAQSWADTFGFNTKRIFSNSPFLTDQARQQMKDTITKKYNTSEKNYKNIYDEYGRQINKITGGEDGTDYITDYSKPFTSLNEDLLNQGTDDPLRIGTPTTEQNNPMGI